MARKPPGASSFDPSDTRPIVAASGLMWHMFATKMPGWRAGAGVRVSVDSGRANSEGTAIPTVDVLGASLFVPERFCKVGRAVEVYRPAHLHILDRDFCSVRRDRSKSVLRIEV